MLATSINYEGLPPVALEFDAAALHANILDSQRHGQPYREFTRRGPCRTGHLIITGRAALPRSPNFRAAQQRPPYQRRGRDIFVEIRNKTISSSVGAAYSDDVAPPELRNFHAVRFYKDASPDGL